MKTFYTIPLLLCVAIVFSLASAIAEDRPNIVLFLADDMGYGELGCYGNSDAITPNLDRFAGEGLRLTDCHAASSVCSPARSSLLTGRTPFRNGVFTWIPPGSPIHLRTSERALPKLLKQVGYDTCHVGKWHLNGLFNSPEQPQPSDHGYAWWLATQNNAAPSHAFPTNFVRNGKAIGKVNDYSAPFIAREAASWLETKRDPAKPFFLAVWTHEPHNPIASAERYQKLHAGISDIEERTYRANITQLDDAFGTVMKTLDNLGVSDSTLVFFTSDNGPEGAGDKGPGRGLAGTLRGRKRSMYEGGHRVPGIVRWPDHIEPGSESDLPIIGSDFFPTALAAAGVDLPEKTLDGVNLLPAIEGHPIERPNPLYWRWGGFVAYREGPWKIVVDESLEKPELYNLDSDVAETVDRIADEPERLAGMMQRLREYTHEVEVEAPDWWKNQSWRKKRKKTTKNSPSVKKSKKTVSVRPAIDHKKPRFVFTAAPRAKQKTPEPETQQQDFSQYALFLDSAARPPTCDAIATTLPLTLKRGDHICLIGNTLFERAQLFGSVPATIHAGFPDHELVIRTLAWSADEVGLMPRPENFADLEQHLFYEKADVILAAFGFNESFAGEAGVPEFKKRLKTFLERVKTKAFNGKTAPRIVLVSPIPNENVRGVAAADQNNKNITRYTLAMREVAAEQHVGFVDVDTPMRSALSSTGDLTSNGCHLTKEGYAEFASTFFESCFGSMAPNVPEPLRLAVVDLERQFFRRYRPLNTFYYTGGRNERYGYLDFLPAMRNFEIMCANRDRRIWDISHGRPFSNKVDDSNVPPLPAADESRGANNWLPASEEKKAFKVDPRFEVNLFAGEEKFPEIANPIQVRWDTRGRLWVCTSQAYPHIYPGFEPHDRLVILEDTDGDGKADTSKIFADDLHVPLSFEFGDGGVYVSEQPNLTFLQDTNGDDRADVHEVVLSGFGTEDSHHALHDFIWTPDGALLFRESIFHHSQIETPHGPVRQQNSGWFRYEPKIHRLTAVGTYPSTNPWGVTFDPWGNHVASHPIFAEAFHSLDPPYPEQHARPQGLQAYSGTCGQAFVDSPGFPAELQGGYIKARYKPTNRIEIHRWIENDFGFNEQYVSDLIFSTNLSFIPVDLHFGPRGDLFIVDWYNPVKGHAQYSLRDSRRDRESGRIWRVTAKNGKVAELPRLSEASVDTLAELLSHREFRVRYLATRELASRDRTQAIQAVNTWIDTLGDEDPRRARSLTEGMACLSTLGTVRPEILVELASDDDHHARAAAIRQLRYWHKALPDRHEILLKAATDSSGLVRMEAAIAASWIGTREALETVLSIFRQPIGGHLAYAAVSALESQPLQQYWQNDQDSIVPALLNRARRSLEIQEPKAKGKDKTFDRRPETVEVRISCEPERMLFTNKQFTVRPGQPVKIVFLNPDATDHNLVLVKPGAMEEVGVAANAMARDPKNATSDFIPEDKQDLILEATPMIGPTRQSLVHVLRFEAPQEPGVYPYVCTFPGHWIVMNGKMVVARTQTEAELLLDACRPTLVKVWKVEDFPTVVTSRDEETLSRGMHAFAKAQCTQCHVMAGHGVNLGPNLVNSVKKLRGKDLLVQILDPSSKIDDDYRTVQFLLSDGRVMSGVVASETSDTYTIRPNLLTPEKIKRIQKTDVEERFPSQVSPMPAGLVNVLTRQEILDLVSFLEAGDNLPAGLSGHHELPSVQ
ncbi:MAG: sulfatase-like hydrolase/transferase [Planctomycetaceae bacterium]|nr:sulfatase-like hydrolase/transferase [Planctomycetaceae bacterium]